MKKFWQETFETNIEWIEDTNGRVYAEGDYWSTSPGTDIEFESTFVKTKEGYRITYKDWFGDMRTIHLYNAGIKLIRYKKNEQDNS